MGKGNGNISLVWRVSVIAFLVGAGLNLLRLGHAPLADTTEARHAEVGREFVERGHWLVPTLDDRPHLTKPPLADWLVAAGIMLFGVSEFGARFGNAIVAALGIALAAGFGCRVGGIRTGLASAVFYFICPLYMALSRTISLDIVLATLALGAYWTAWEASRETCAHPRWAALGWATCMALGVLTKGHIILLIGLVPLLVWIALGKHWQLARRLAWPPAILLFLAIALPWYVYIVRTFPDWLPTTLVDEFQHRVVGRKYGEAYVGQAILYFLAGALPIVPMGFLSLVSWLREPPTQHRTRDVRSILCLWMAIPLAVFSVPHCQRLNYVMPLMPAAAIMAAMVWSGLAANWSGVTGWQRAVAYLSAAIPAVCSMVCLVGYLILSWTSKELGTGGFVLVVVGAAGSVLASVACIWRLARVRLDGAAAMFVVCVVFLWALSLPITDVAKQRRSTRMTGEWVKENLDSHSKVIMYHIYMPSCNFYTGRYLEVFNGEMPGVEWQNDWPTPDLSRDVLTREDLERSSRIEGGIWVIAKRQKLDDIAEFAQTGSLELDVKNLDTGVSLVHLSVAHQQSRSSNKQIDPVGERAPGGGGNVPSTVAIDWNRLLAHGCEEQTGGACGRRAVSQQSQAVRLVSWPDGGCPADRRALGALR